MSSVLSGGGGDDFFNAYLEYTRNTEACSIYHRWAAISAIGAILGRNQKFEFGHANIYPNMYIMMIGDPGTRKTTAINIAKRTVEAAGYNFFAPNKVTKEKFLSKLSAGMNSSALAHPSCQSPTDKKRKALELSDDFLEQNLFGTQTERVAHINERVSECYVCNDEFNNFIGIANMEFISLLGEFWDYEGVYTNEYKNSESDLIPNPCISILGGNTHTNFATAFPASVLGQGFFSRLLLIYGEKLRPKITIPPKPDPGEKAEIVAWLCKIRDSPKRIIEADSTAFRAIDKIYHTWKDLEDTRFISYSNRRFTHLLKLCMIYAASRFSPLIQERDVLRANTVLSFAESFMPKAMGEIGRNRSAEVTQKIMHQVNQGNADGGAVTFLDIWKNTVQDFEKQGDLITILQNLGAADKIQSVKTKHGSGFLPNKRALEEINEGNKDLLDWDLLTDEERSMKR